jgi:hypothetical protein
MLIHFSLLKRVCTSIPSVLFFLNGAWNDDDEEIIHTSTF